MYPPNHQRLVITYQDEELIAVNKPSGLAAHRGYATDDCTVADIVRDDIAKQPVHAIHRLDRGTSGVMLFALNPHGARVLQEQIAAGKMRKRYWALVRGHLKEAVEIDHAIRQRDCNERVHAVTHFTPLAYSGRWCLLEARPITGRTHQIRLHLKHLSLPIIGDVRYGKGEINRYFRENYHFSRLALHAVELTFEHPNGQREVKISAGLPDEFENLLSSLGMATPQL